MIKIKIVRVEVDKSVSSWEQQLRLKKAFFLLLENNRHKETSKLKGLELKAKEKE